MGLIAFLTLVTCIFLLTFPFAFFINGTDPVDRIVRDATTLRTEASVLPAYFLRMAIFLVALALVVSNYQAIIKELKKLVHLWIFIAWLVLSVAWSDEPGTSINSIIALMLLIVPAYLVSLSLGPVNGARALIASGVMMAICSILIAILLPSYGVHQVEDVSQAVHAGAWRGVYIHKNHLGQTSAVYAVAVFMAGKKIIPWSWLKWSLFSLFIALVLLSTSASAISIVVLAPLLTKIFVGFSPKRTFIAAFYLILGIAFASLALPQILDMLGRDLTFTGRTEIWAYAISNIALSPLLGFGFGSATYGVFSYQLIGAFGVRDPHSSFFDLTLAVGIVGLASFFIVIVQSWRAARQWRQFGPQYEQAGLIYASTLNAWLFAGFSESAIRPFVAVSAVGFFSIVALRKLNQETKRRTHT